MKQITALLLALLSCGAQAQSEKSWEFGAVLDLTHTSRDLALGMRDKGLQLGHSDVTASGPLGVHFRGHVGAVFATHDGKLEKGIEDAYVETTSLPYGLQMRLGRFASQVGHLNQQHMHADDFTERPLLYRGLFGGHWNDDGLRLNVTLPTSFYWMVGAEAFHGKKLVADSVYQGKAPGAMTLVTKLGADLNRSHSWQMGVSYIHNRREALAQEAHEGEEEHSHTDEDHHGHEHAHGAEFSGRHTWMLDATWKWAPGGNNREQQLRVNFEAARVTDLNRFASSKDKHEANALSVVYRFHPSWEVGARADWLRVSVPQGEHFHQALLRERSVMLAWKPTHMQSLRLQVSQQHDAVEFEAPSSRTVQMQYVLAFGAHGAHGF